MSLPRQPQDDQDGDGHNQPEERGKAVERTVRIVDCKPNRIGCLFHCQLLTPFACRAQPTRLHSLASGPRWEGESHDEGHYKDVHRRTAVQMLRGSMAGRQGRDYGRRALQASGAHGDVQAGHRDARRSACGSRPRLRLDYRHAGQLSRCRHLPGGLCDRRQFDFILTETPLPSVT